MLQKLTGLSPATRAILSGLAICGCCYLPSFATGYSLSAGWLLTLFGGFSTTAWAIERSVKSVLTRTVLLCGSGFTVFFFVQLTHSKPPIPIAAAVVVSLFLGVIMGILAHLTVQRRSSK